MRGHERAVARPANSGCKGEAARSVDGGSGPGVGRAASVGAEPAGPAGRGLDEGGGAVLALGRGRVGDHEVPELLRDLDEGLSLLCAEAVPDGVGDLLPGGVSPDDAGAS